jgi:hypothetical protein
LQAAAQPLERQFLSWIPHHSPRPRSPRCALDAQRSNPRSVPQLAEEFAQSKTAPSRPGQREIASQSQRLRCTWTVSE